MFYTDPKTGKEAHLNQVKIAGLTDKIPMGVSQSNVGRLDIIVSEPAMDQLIKDDPAEESQSLIFLKSKDPMKTQQEMRESKVRQCACLQCVSRQTTARADDPGNVGIYLWLYCAHYRDINCKYFQHDLNLDFAAKTGICDAKIRGHDAKRL